MKKLLLSMLAIVSLHTAQIQSAAWAKPAFAALKASTPAIMKNLGYASVATAAVVGYCDAKTLANKADEHAGNAVAVAAAGVGTANKLWNLIQILGPKYGLDFSGLTKEQKALVGLSELSETSWYKKLAFKSGSWIYGVVALTAQQIATQAIQSMLIHGLNSAIGVGAAAVKPQGHRIEEQNIAQADAVSTPVPARMRVVRRR